MIMWPLIPIVIGLLMIGSGMFNYLQGTESRIIKNRVVKDWHVTLGLGILNLAVGLFILIDLNT